ncbi:MAG: DinB family protein, partial [Bryobacteraceae bacterium]
SQALEMFRRLRTDNHELLKDLPESTFARSGTHSNDGPMTLRQLVEWHASHLEDHVRKIQSARAAYRDHRARQAVT